jgi:hypothetical protein
VPDLNAPALIEVLQRHRVAFLVIGGYAGVMMGSPIPTLDVDVVPHDDRENLQRLSTALTELEAKVRNGDGEPLPFARDATSLASAVFWNLTTKHGDLDITFTPSGTEGYADLRRDAATITLNDSPLLIASLADVIRSKEAAGRDKDRRALPILRELLAEQLRDKRNR